MDKLKYLSKKMTKHNIDFLKIIGITNLLDITSIHHGSYNIAFKILYKFNIIIKKISTEKVKIVLENINIDDLSFISNDKYWPSNKLNL